MLQCAAVCCSVLQCAAVCCSALQCVAVCCSVLQCAAVCCSVLQCAAVCCSVLHCVVVYCSVLQCVAVCRCALQCAAVCYNVLQRVAVIAIMSYMYVCMTLYTPQPQQQSITLLHTHKVSLFSPNTHRSFVAYLHYCSLFYTRIFMTLYTSRTRSSNTSSSSHKYKVGLFFPHIFLQQQHVVSLLQYVAACCSVLQ